MSVLLFVCLIFLTKIATSDSAPSQYESTSNDKIYNQGNIRKLVNVETQNIKTENTTNGTRNGVNKAPPIKGQDKNETATKKPDTEGMDTQSSQTLFSFPPYAAYEVTENVSDIPDNRSPAGPIVTNYTVRPPILNLAKPTNKTDKDKITENKIQNKKNSFTLLHINAEFDDKVHENKIVGVFKGLKECIHSFQRSIVNGIHSFFHKHQDDHDHGERYERAVDTRREKNHGVKNVDKTEYFVHRRHISMT